MTKSTTTPAKTGARWRWLIAVIAVLAIIAASCGDDGDSTADEPSNEPTDAPSDEPSDEPSGDEEFVVALSNSFIGNDWRKTMVESFEIAAEAAVASGDITDYRVEITAENTATAQIASIESLILAGVEAIVINSASPTALDPVIQRACDEGIIVVVFDSLAEAECATKVFNDFEDWGRTQAELVLEGIGGEGDIIMVEGVTGSAPNDTVLAVWAEELAKYPDVNVVATVIGQNDGALTQQALVPVLPSLGDIDGVLLQVGANGVINAFQDAGRDLPVVDLDTHGGTLRIWDELNKSVGFETSAVLTDPGQGSAALWVAIMIGRGEQVDGQDIPDEVVLPLVVIPQEDLEAWIAVTPDTAMAGWSWTKEQTIAAIASNLAGEEAVAPPIPTP